MKKLRVWGGREHRAHSFISELRLGPRFIDWSNLLIKDCFERSAKHKRFTNTEDWIYVLVSEVHVARFAGNIGHNIDNTGIHFKAIKKATVFLIYKNEKREDCSHMFKWPLEHSHGFDLCPVFPFPSLGIKFHSRAYSSAIHFILGESKVDLCAS